MGSSTARTPALTATEKEASDELQNGGKRRHICFGGLGRRSKRATSKKTGDDSDGTEEHETKEKAKNHKKHGSQDESSEQDSEPGSWWKCLRCL